MKRKQVLLLVVMAGVTVEAWATPRSEAIVSPFATPPTVDGVMAPDEWDGAFQSIGFQSIAEPHRPAHGTPLLDPRRGKAWFGYRAVDGPVR